jgi:hypothetical protein
VKHGHVTGRKRERQPRQATLAKHTAQAELFTDWLATKTVEELLSMTPQQAQEELKKRQAA